MSWLKYVYMWDWHELSLAGWPGWERSADDPSSPPSVSLEFVMGKDGRSPSHKLASEWDDVAECHFYWRDWTTSGLPCVGKDETFRSRFWFQTAAEAERFKEFAGGLLTPRRDDPVHHW